MQSPSLGPDVLGHRAKIGVIVPATNTVVQPEYESMRVDGVTNHVSRMTLPVRPYDDMARYREALDTEEGDLEQAIRLVTCCEPDIIAHGHSIHSFRGDAQRAMASQERLAKVAGVPFVTPSVAVLKGLEAIGNPRRLGVLTPYWPPADDLVAGFFRASGYEVVRVDGLKCQGPTNVARTPLAAIKAGFASVDHPDVEALVHVGTNLPVTGITQELEDELGKPLIGVNVATYWLALRTLGLKDRKAGFGKLLAEC
ncbi:MAG: hypothetical protein QHC78_09760 [Pigmentiphaga sp.]|uniref:maleate cis-trans isomerase family protein n=1 Tax=Pigmentiphaga sp. TaxID=1977564 RepID=UPI0029A2853C|nr:hypothetical protein [Pigmentiphaga sp.]MDX3905959.1 hypothetical protein [Pigmentiphaga sp.]